MPLTNYSFRNWYEEHKRPFTEMVMVQTTYRSLYAWYDPRGFRLRGFLPDLWYYLTCKYWHKYNCVTAKTLPPTWGDVYNKIIHINFEMLRSVVEDEGWFTHWAFACEECQDGSCESCAKNDMAQYWRNHMATCQELGTLYDWWINKRPERQDSSDWLAAQCAKEGIPTESYFAPTNGMSEMRHHGTPEQQERYRVLLFASADIEANQEQEDTDMLVRLMEMRENLWT